MLTSAAPALRQFGVALRAVIAATVILGIAYPLFVTGVSQVVFPSQANGSLIQSDGRDVGSRLLGQGFTRPVIVDGQPQVDEDGEPVTEADPAWFQSRPSAVDWNGLASGASQLGPNNPDLIAVIEQRRAEVAATEGVDPSAVPADALTSSGSGLDPDISPAYADLQVARVARTRGLPETRVRELVAASTHSRTLGFLGEPRVNVVTLNDSLAAAG